MGPLRGYIIRVHQEGNLAEGKVLRVQQDGDFDFHRVLKMEPINFLMMT
jgi:hypothetical protein